jgi:hypothetical protein
MFLRLLLALQFASLLMFGALPAAHAAPLVITEAQAVIQDKRGAADPATRFPEGAPTQRIQLPDDWADNWPRQDGPVWYRVTFDTPPGTAPDKFRLPVPGAVASLPRDFPCMAFNLKKVLKALLLSSSQPLAIKDIQAAFTERARSFLEDAPTTAAQAARIILDGVKAEQWRILVGEDAKRLDERVRATPEQAYDRAFFESFTQEVGWRLG